MLKVDHFEKFIFSLDELNIFNYSRSDIQNPGNGILVLNIIRYQIYMLMYIAKGM